MKTRSIAFLAAAILGAAAGHAQIALNSIPSRTVGHPKTPQLEQNTLYSFNPNLVEGREFYSPQGIAVDTSLTPPAAYVSDTGNNRVLGWRNATGFSNGQPADIVIGQSDFYTTWPEGPTTTPHAPGASTPLQSGLNSPTDLAVYNGDLYVADMGNNRILRFPQPFSQTIQYPNLVVGQPNFSAAAANYTGQVGPQGISLASAPTASMAFDGSGNLWITDSGNRRVLEFAASDIAVSGEAGPTAITVLGQVDFTSQATPLTAGAAQVPYQFAVPAGIAFDSSGNLYVSDANASSPTTFSRVLVFEPPFTNGMAATRIMGVASSSGSPSQIGATAMDSPKSIFFFPNNQGIGVVDSGYSRILVFPALANWPSATTQFSPQASGVIGQNGSFTAFGPNNTAGGSTFLNPPNAGVFNQPMAAAVAGSELYVADAGNNRVIVMPLLGTIAGLATRVLGQYSMTTGSINLIEGREFQFFTVDTSGNVHYDAGVAVDNTGPVPHLYVADPANNRVLAFADMRKVSAGVAADLVIGQPTGQTALCNYPSNNPNLPTASGLCAPVGLLVDSAGNLWVVDRGNGRVVRFPTPFSQSGPPTADTVLGQASLTTPAVTIPSAVNMAAPYGLAMTPGGALAVSDQAQNRILVFQPTAGAFRSGQAAALVIGQPSFTTTASGTDQASLSAPHHIAADASGRLYVADSVNNRVQIFDNLDGALFPSTGALAAFSITGLKSPEGVYVNPTTGELWVAAAGAGTYVRYPKYVTLVTNPVSIGSIAAPSYTLAVAQDEFGSLIGADATNRVAFFYPGATTANLGNGLARPLAPGALAEALPLNASVPFGATTASFGTQIPLPTTLANIQVQFNGLLAPLLMVSPTQINFQVPMEAPTSGYADLLISNVATGQVYGAGEVAMNAVSPALLLNPSTQTGTIRQVAAINYSDSSVNGSGHPVKDGAWIELFGTGQGVVPNAPADGAEASGITPTSTRPMVVINGCWVDDPTCTNEPNLNHIYYSGLAPGLVGVWQINVLIPQNTCGGCVSNLTGNQADIAVILDSVVSYDPTQYRTIIYAHP
jgi:uncharacterized protein (TIGR03437 family)